ncbi:MAG: tol-pal system-associated acyl-CoA thioesterase [Betaproteobacteria bacterium]|nr:tol-pal system-associated acyl-CoA thioesterase [Betaproteobacteria bacterium]
MKSSAFHLPVRVYYEDTDAAGVVYYASYLKFIERGRTEWLRKLGHEQTRLAQDLGIAFAVRSMTAEYFKPARLDDQLNVCTRMLSLGRAQLAFDQKVERGDELLFSANIRVACFDPQRYKATAIPKALHEKFKALIGKQA